MGLAQLLEGGACLRSAKERFHVRVEQVEDGRAVAYSRSASSFLVSRGEREDGRTMVLASESKSYTDGGVREQDSDSSGLRRRGDGGQK